MGVTVPLEKRFWAKVDMSGDCWNWTGCKTAQGYGRIGAYGTVKVAHRISYEFAMEPIPEGMVIDHICHNESCVRPSHLRACTQKQNNEHKAQEGFSSSGIRGVTWHKQHKKWYARVGHFGRLHDVGLFDDLEQAKAAVIAKRLELFTHNDIDRMAS
jgi:hypothetical protein